MCGRRWQRVCGCPFHLSQGLAAQSSSNDALGQDSGVGRGDTVALGPVLTLIMVPLAGEESSDLIRHFLIESSTKGVHLKGASEELYFGKDGAVAHSSPGSARSCFQSPWKHQAGPSECVAHLPAQEPPSPWSCPHFPDSGTVAVAPKQEHELPGMLAG